MPAETLIAAYNDLADELAAEGRAYVRAELIAEMKATRVRCIRLYNIDPEN